MKSGSEREKFNWTTIQNEIAEERSAAIVLLDENSSALAVSNDNSICRHLYPSAEFASRCAEFCGRAFETAHAAGKAVHVKCHADLNFLTVPLVSKDKKLAAIVGRVFLQTEDYRLATSRAIDGDWQQFPPADFFANVLIARSPGDLEKTAKRLGRLSDEKKDALARFVGGDAAADDETAKSDETSNAPVEDSGADENNSQPEKLAPEIFKRNAAEIEELSAWREVFGGLLESDYERASLSVLNFLAQRFALANLAWLEARENSWERVAAIGQPETRQIKIAVAADDERFAEVLCAETSLTLRERGADDAENLQVLQMFPAAVGGKTRGALIVADEIDSAETSRRIFRFLREVAPELEILRLRRELGQQAKISAAVRKLNESLKNIDSENFWDSVAEASAELVDAERGSLLGFDEAKQNFFFRAATGSRAGQIKTESETLGENVARRVLAEDQAVAIGDIEASDFPSAPAERNYRTKSFVSYPIKIGERKVGIFNAADKLGERAYDESDLKLLDQIAPQIAVALERTTYKKKAKEFERLSVTDALTGLLNRRYLEERLSEEISRAQRTGYPVSFMMIDVDEFKSYNDRFSHPEGDKALKIVGRLMKESLRVADVAARYGGEEFSILLPQTSLPEAQAIAERLREKVAGEDFPNRRVTISVGIAAVSSGVTTAHDLVSAADKALYKAKQAGRNNVKIHEESAAGTTN